MTVSRLSGRARASVRAAGGERLPALIRLLFHLFRGSASGASLVEYLIVAGCVSLCAIGAFHRYGKVIHAGLKSEAARIEGKGLPSAAELLSGLGNTTPPVCDRNNRALCVQDSPFCFAQGTPVATENGDRPIESIRVGERVWARDTERGIVALRPVVKTFARPNVPVVDLSLATRAANALGSSLRDERLVVTPNHLFWVEHRGWARADELGQEQLGSLDAATTALSLTTLARAEPVYNIEVEEFHSYFVGHSHVLVHNGCPPTPGEQALRTALQNAGLDPSRIAAIEAQINSLPAHAREAARKNIADAINVVNGTTLSPAEKADAATAIANAATDPQIEGFDDWLKHVQTGSKSAGNIRDEINELKVASAKAKSSGPGGKVTVGLDQKEAEKAAAENRNPQSTFDMVVNDGGKTTNVEVYSPQGKLSKDDLGKGINHAADKVTSTTTGSVEGAVVLSQPWPPAPSTSKAGTVTVAPNGDRTLTTPNGMQIDQGNDFDDFLDNLNGTGKGGAPKGAAKVDSLVVYDQNGNPIVSFTKDATGKWSKSPP